MILHNTNNWSAKNCYDAASIDETPTRDNVHSGVHFARQVEILQVYVIPTVTKIVDSVLTSVNVSSMPWTP